MCLTYQALVPVPDTGYKSCIRRKNGTLVTSLTLEPIAEGEWVEDKETYDLSDGKGEQYFTGFHVFTKESDAHKWGSCYGRVVEVEIDKESVTATGFQYITDQHVAPVVVCRRIKVKREMSAQ